MRVKTVKTVRMAAQMIFSPFKGWPGRAVNV